MLLVLVAAGCAPHGGQPAPTRGLLGRLRNDARYLQAKDDERTAIENRATMREHHRRNGLRACEEGEDGTSWREDCKVCRCEQGWRRCPAVHCTDPRVRAEMQRRRRERSSTDANTNARP